MRHQSFWRRLLLRRPKRQSFYESQRVMMDAIERKAGASQNSPAVKRPTDPSKPR